jgi:hypothetical protein
MFVPTPAHILYKTLLTLLERITVDAVSKRDPESLAEVHEIIRSLRKALSLQKSLEARWESKGLMVDHRWS